MPRGIGESTGQSNKSQLDRLTIKLTCIHPVIGLAPIESLENIFTRPRNHLATKSLKIWFCVMEIVTSIHSVILILLLSVSTCLFYFTCGREHDKICCSAPEMLPFYTHCSAFEMLLGSERNISIWFEHLMYLMCFFSCINGIKALIMHTCVWPSHTVMIYLFKRKRKKNPFRSCACEWQQQWRVHRGFSEV